MSPRKLEVTPVTTDALTYLLRTRESRQAPDHFARNTVLSAFALWLILMLLVVFWGQQAEAVTSLGIGILYPVSFVLAIALPLRQVQKDASLHASFFGGRCYNEILGTLVQPGEILDQVATHSTRACLRHSAPWALLITLLWLLLCPGAAPRILLLAGLWLPASVLCVWGTSYLAQQLCIYNVQLKGGLVTSVGDSLIGIVTAVPVAVCVIVGLGALVSGHLWLSFGCILGYLIFTLGFSRWVATTGLEKLPHLRQKVQELSRKWLGTPRNRFVRAWSDNAIIVRERTRDSARIPGHLPGALLFQLPLASFAVIVAAFHDARGADYGVIFYLTVFVGGSIQLLTASRRCCTAIVAEVEAQTMEPLQNTRLHATEFLRAWLQLGSYTRLLENLIILVPLSVFCHHSVTLWYLVPCALVFLFSPVVGAALGLSASYASNREKASRAHSEALGQAFCGWMLLFFAFGVVAPHLVTAGWPYLLLFYCFVLFALHMRRLLRKIEVN